MADDGRDGDREPEPDEEAADDGAAAGEGDAPSTDKTGGIQIEAAPGAENGGSGGGSTDSVETDAPDESPDSDDESGRGDEDAPGIPDEPDEPDEPNAPDDAGTGSGTDGPTPGEEPRGGEPTGVRADEGRSGDGHAGDGSTDDGLADDEPTDDVERDAGEGDATDADAVESDARDVRDADANAGDPAPDADESDDASGAPGPGDGGRSGTVPGPDVGADVPEDVRKYDRFQKMDRAEYDRVNEFLRDRTYVTAREWAIARLCADFRTETGVEMTKIGENLPRLVPFMTDTYTPQAVNQARSAFEEKVRKSGATFLYGAMCGFFTAEELDDVMYEVTEVAKFLLEVEGVDLAVEEELAAEDKISSVMRDVREASAEVRGDEVKCPECGHVHEP